MAGFLGTVLNNNIKQKANIRQIGCVSLQRFGYVMHFRQRDQQLFDACMLCVAWHEHGNVVHRELKQVRTQVNVPCEHFKRQTPPGEGIQYRAKRSQLA